MIYTVVKNKPENIALQEACSSLQVSRRAYDNWAHKPDTTDDGLLERIKHILRENEGYGYRRVTKSFPREEKVNHKKVLKTMKEHGLLCDNKRKAFKPQTTDSNHCHPVAPNRIKDMIPKTINEVWVSDITYIPLRNGFAYLAVVMDRFSRKCLGWKLSKKIDSKLTVDALTIALNARQGQHLDRLIHHSDRGVQYANNWYIEMLEQHGIQASMSAKGNPYDNAFAESFIKTIKAEAVYLNEYDTFDDALADIECFIEKKYNKKRLHSSIGYMPPDEFEQKILKEVVA